MQMTNLKHTVTHLENSRFINIRMALIANLYAYTCCELGCKYSWEIYKYETKIHSIISG